MSSRVDRFKKRQELKEKTTMHFVSSQEEVDKMLDCEVDEEKLKGFDYLAGINSQPIANPREAEKLLKELEDEFDSKRVDELLNQTQKDIFQAIIVPFGLGKIVSAYDKAGGNVDTIHNAREGIYATDEEKSKYDNKEKYNADNYHKDERYKKINKQYSKDKKAGNAEDYMSGEKFAKNAKTDLDHVVSAKEIDIDAGRVLADVDGAELANTETNLQLTSSSKNRSKKAKSMDDFLNQQQSDSQQRANEINMLEKKGNLTEKERKKLEKLKDLESINSEKAKQADAKAREEINKKINSAYYKSGKFAKNLASTSALEGSKMGLQQALGLVILEVLTASFEEIKLAYNEGLEGESLFEDIKIRLKRVAKKVSSKWKDFIVAFKDGAISGFISNIITTIINTFITTGKRLVRMIREGFYSLIKAIKLLLNPPKEMSKQEVCHEAVKLMAGGAVVVGGIMLEEAVDKAIKATVVFEFMSDILTTVIVGALTAIVASLVVYLLDKLDLFGAIQMQKDKFVIDKLDESINQKIFHCNEMLAEMDKLSLEMVS